MCGIVYSKSLVGRPVNKTILKRYIFQRSRGTDGFGFYTPETNRLTHNVREGRILSLLRRNKKATEILFHHRMPTSTMNVRNACHPFSTKDYFEHNYVVVHNGVLWNEDILKKEHELRGIDYVSEQEDGSYNDSEALTYDVARYIEGEVTKLTAEGTIAFIAIQRSKEGETLATYFGRNSGNPLKLVLTDKSFTLSSEGDGEMIDPDTLYCYNHKTGVLTRSPCRIPSSNYSSNRGHWYGGNYDDEEMREMELYNNGFGYDAYGNYIGITSKDTAHYFRGESERTKALAHEEVERLMDENYDDPNAAISAGKSEIKGLEKIEDDLRDSVEITQTADENDVDKFYTIGDRLYYLRMAVDALEQGVSGQSQMGFHYTPDHESYIERHNRQVLANISDTLRAAEAVDPSGRVFYPYAE